MIERNLDLEKSIISSLVGNSLIPERMHGGIMRYIVYDIPPGDFLRAIISNDLSGACLRADNENINLLGEYVKWFYNHAPLSCWGSEHNYAEWKGLLTIKQ